MSASKGNFDGAIAHGYNLERKNEYADARQHDPRNRTQRKDVTHIRMTKRLFLAMCLMVTMEGVSVAATDEQVPDRRHQPLVFLANKILPPMVYMQDGKRVGIIVDLGEALQRQLDQPVRLEYMGWAEAQQEVLQGEADALLHINPSEARKERFDFSDVLLESEFSIFTKYRREGIYDLTSLRNVGTISVVETELQCSST
jgi:ABC-type amino acid transport substrate-binding protein